MTTTHTKSRTWRSTSESSYPNYLSTEGYTKSRSSRSLASEDIDEVSAPTFKYVLGELIGKGSYAKVFLALNANNGELIAVKRVERPRTASDRASSHQLEMVEALKFESDTLKGLEHPNIVQYLGFEQTPETLNIFLEYIPGGTIGSVIAKHGRFTQEVTKYFSAQILAGLEYLHSTGILHRDLKGDNILVELSGVCKISDFGISKREDVQGQAFTNMRGTSFWMAPEVLDSNNKRGYDSKVDIWSLGCVVVEMWTGRRPWAGEEFLPVMLKLYNGTPPPVPPDILADLSELALDFRNECFTINPQARPTAAILRNHPYLQPTPGWVFQVSEIERSTARLANGHKRDQVSHRHRNSSVPASHHRRSATEETPPMPTRPNDSMLTARPSEHLRLPPNDSSTLRPGSRRRHTSRASSNEPPPIVYITPPSSPVRGSSRSSVSPATSATSESTRASGSLRSRKSFYIANPDPDDHDPQESFVYHPPPLPTGSTLRSPPLQLSERRRKELQSRVSVADFKAAERRLPSASASAQQLASRFATASSSRQSMSSRADSYSDSDSDSNAGSMWKKPPVDLTNLKSSSSSKAKKFAKRRSIIETKRESTWAPRPGVNDVYSRLEDFFPQVDLDKPVAASSSERQRRTKSIRMAAETRIRRAKTTKVWGQKAEEVTMYTN
ncbi:kinase-like domain-containing protein [Mycena alexandri]|uniref:Kinase-like domain-containing protein n=1 Tax=Mycena alexandri TaxID=1745969 RepID=A0AAD6T4G8_9AGAR|nr:kinase-like domain-containing protein [Mycena alexandri]